MMAKILIIGAGFGGLSVAKGLCKSGIATDVTLIDKKQTADFLPLLPDCIGRLIRPDYLADRIDYLGKRLGFSFINEEVTRVDLEKKEAFTARRSIKYDYLVISSGSETNFYGNDNIKQHAFVLDDVNDVKKIINALGQNNFENFIIGGAGYTGVEAATNLRRYFNGIKAQRRIVIVERMPEILGPLPEWMKEYVADNLKRLQVEVFLNCTLEKIEGSRVYLADGKVFDNAMVIWAAGVEAPGFVQNLNVEKNPQGRIKVDECLRFKENCFAVGDAANFFSGNSYLRMAVQFAITEGECVAKNLIAIIKGSQPRKYRPQDLGYIIPMANNRSCGEVLGFRLKGIIPTALHFIMCVYRSRGPRNKFGIFKSLNKARLDKFLC